MRVTEAGRSLAPPSLKWRTPQLPPPPGRSGGDSARRRSTSGGDRPAGSWRFGIPATKGINCLLATSRIAATSPKCLQLPLGGLRADRKPERGATCRVFGLIILIRQ
jgi:hypothetical protein